MVNNFPYPHIENESTIRIRFKISLMYLLEMMNSNNSVVDLESGKSYLRIKDNEYIRI